MSTLPSVVSRFVEYYAALDSQPPSALVGLYHSNATLIDPFSAISPICWPTSSIAVLPSMTPCAAKTGLWSPG